MAEDEDQLHQSVTEFMLGTCRRSASFAFIDFVAKVVTAKTAKALFDNTAGELFTSGSSAEFYIKPVLSCIDDIDFMSSYTCYLAVPDGHILPTELPSHYSHKVEVYAIIDSPRRGYVYLRPLCDLQKNDVGYYDALSKEKGGNVPDFLHGSLKHDSSIIRTVALCVSQQYLPKHVRNNRSLEWQHCIQPILGSQPHGPAITHSKFDMVFCMRCLIWPPQAADWPRRSRSHGWPDSTTIDVVVNNGCDVVRIAHPSCRQDEWVRERQWRLSFSRAEVTLLNSWTTVQQVIYHMLRFVLKREVIWKTDNANKDLPKLSNYHVKTLMLWESEQKPQSWWSTESSVVKLCSSIIHKLCDWVVGKRCRHYFIINCNILDHIDDDASLMIYDSMKNLADVSFLLAWFVKNYVSKSAQCCSTDMLSEDVSTEKLQSMVHSAIDQNMMNTPCHKLSLSLERQKSETQISCFLHNFSFNAEWAQIVMKELPNFDLRLRDYFAAVASLHVAYKISRHSLTESLLDVLWTLLGPCTVVVNDRTNRKLDSAGILSIRKAIKLATLSSARSNALEMLHNEMSKALLHHSFEYRNECTYRMVHVFLAVLYNKSGHCQEVVAHCKQLLNQSFARGQYGLRIGAEYLPQIDESVDVVFALILFYQHIQQIALATTELAFTAELLAQFLYSKCTADRKSVTEYRQRLFLTERPSLGDVLLFKCTEIQLKTSANVGAAVEVGSARADSVSRSMDTGLLAATLELVALEQLTEVRQTTVRELQSGQFPVLNEFEALYAYRCGLFEHCLEMCRDYVVVVLSARVPLNQIYNVEFPELLSLLDGALVSLWGIVRILHPTMLFYTKKYISYMKIFMPTLSLYLMAQCQKKLRSNSVGDTLRKICRVRDILLSYEDCHMDQLILRLTYRSLKLYVADTAGAD